MKRRKGNNARNKQTRTEEKNQNNATKGKISRNNKQQSNGKRKGTKQTDAKTRRKREKKQENKYFVYNDFVRIMYARVVCTAR